MPENCWAIPNPMPTNSTYNNGGLSKVLKLKPVIFEAAGFHPIKNAILATFVIGLVNFIFTGITLLLVDKLGRRFLLLSGMLLAAISLFLTSDYYQQQWLDQKWLMLFFMSMYMIGYCVSVGSLFWVIISEIYPLNVRGFAMSIATIAQWGANFLVSISFLELLHGYGEMITFCLFGLICLLAFIFIYFYVPETSHVSLEKIEENLAAGKKMRELGMAMPSSKKEITIVLAAESHES